MSSDDFIEANDKIETEPVELHEVIMKALEGSFSKKYAARVGVPWTQELETAYQESISVLVSEARRKGLTAFIMIAVKPDGRRVRREISIEKLSKTRVLQ